MRPVARRGALVVRGLRLVWHEWGAPDAPVAICLHGFMDHGRSFGFMAEHAADELRLVAPDLRGHGESDWVGAGGYYHFYDYFHDVHRLVREVGVERVLLVGHSMGGSIAVGIAALLRDRARGLVLLEGMGPRYARLEESRDRLARWTLSLDQPGVDGDVSARRAARRPMASVEVATARLRQTNPRLPEDRARALAESFTEPVEVGSSSRGVVWRCDPLHRTPAVKPYLEAEARPTWSSITAPTVSLFGEHGFLPPDVDDRHRALPNVVPGWVPGAGHNLHHERPELVAEALLTLHRDGRPRLPTGARQGPPPPHEGPPGIGRRA